MVKRANVVTAVTLNRTVKQLQDAIAAKFPSSQFELIPDEEDAAAWGLHVYSNAAPRKIREIALDEIARVLVEEDFALYVVSIPRKQEAERQAVDVLLEEPLGTPVHLTREQAVAIVEAGIGDRPDLPAGTEYVSQIREAWRGLTDRGTGSL